MSTPSELNVISLNCWGLKYVSKLRRERLSEIGRQLAVTSPVPTIVGLQECWMYEDFSSIHTATKHILPYAKFYFGGVFGAGLAILSKWPIEESSMMGYPLNGRPTAFWRGDWYVGKGVACARVRYGSDSRDILEVFNTHLHAPYEREPNDSYLCHRTAQAWEIAKLMRGATERGHLVIGLGDFNMLPLSLAHDIICTHGCVEDAWRVLHPDSSIGSAEDEVERTRGRAIPSAQFNLVENGATCDNVCNTWRWNKAHQRALGQGKPAVEVSQETLDPRAKRLDYVFTNINGASAGNDSGTSGIEWDVTRVKVGMTQRHPALGCSLSDHFSIETTIARTSTLSCSAMNTRRTRSRFMPVETYDSILSLTNAYILRESRQRRLQLYHFLISLFVSFGCLVAIWWVPHDYVAFILLLVSTLNLSAGVVDGLIGGLFMSSELRSLEEFEWEVKNTRRLALAHMHNNEGAKEP